MSTYHRIQVALVLSLTAFTFASSLSAEGLRYQWQKDQKFAYEFDISVTAPDSVTQFKGLVHYNVDAATPEQMRVTYRGGLQESQQAKGMSRARPGFGGPMGPRGFSGMMGNPFGRPTFSGKVQTTNRITLTPQGKILAMEGDSQLPYLLGNVSLLPFELLPKEEQREWTLDTGVSITETDDSNRRPFGQFGPFAGQERNSVQAGSEVARYAIQSEDNQFVVIKKSYQLITPATEDHESFDMTGGGTWTFDRKESIPHAMDFSFKLLVKAENTSATIPITLRMNRVSAEEVARREAEAKQKAEAMKKAADEAKSLAERPLTEEEKQQALQGLRSSNTDELQKTLASLGAKTPKESDAEIVAALQPLITHETKTIADAAVKAMMNWDPVFKRKRELNKAYQGPSPVGSTDRPIESTTPLFVGQIVQVQEHGSFWYPAKIVELMPDGKVKVGMLTWNDIRRSITVTRRNMQLAPDEVDQPNAPKEMAVAAKTRRMWSDATGRFKIEAEFVSLVDGKVNLLRADGKNIAVPLEKLSAEDQKLAQKAQEDSENPFEQ